MKNLLLTSILLLCFLMGVLIGNRITIDNSIKEELTVNTNPNRIVLSNYDIRNNLYSVIYIQNNDTLALDYLYPIELDSLINELNNNNNE